MTFADIYCIFRYLISRGYGHPQDKDSGGSDDEMSDEGTDDMLPSTSREGSGGRTGSGGPFDSSSHRLEFLIGENVLPFNMTVYQVCMPQHLFHIALGKVLRRCVIFLSLTSHLFCLGGATIWDKSNV